MDQIRVHLLPISSADRVLHGKVRSVPSVFLSIRLVRGIVARVSRANGRARDPLSPRFVGNALGLQNSPDENISRLTTDTDRLQSEGGSLTFRHRRDGRLGLAARR